MSNNIALYMREMDRHNAVVSTFRENTATIHTVEYRKMQELLVGTGLQDQIRNVVQSLLTPF